MKCPHCDETLQMAERSGIEIDYCPTCRGIWLDRGELDKLLSRAASEPAPPPYAGVRPPDARAPRTDESRREPRDDYRRFDDDDDYRDGRPRKRKRLGSFLEDLFDF